VSLHTLQNRGVCLKMQGVRGGRAECGGLSAEGAKC